jgi:hypothetical protein
MLDDDHDYGKHEEITNHQPTEVGVSLSLQVKSQFFLLKSQCFREQVVGATLHLFLQVSCKVTFLHHVFLVTSLLLLANTETFGCHQPTVIESRLHQQYSGQCWLP